MNLHEVANFIYWRSELEEFPEELAQRFQDEHGALPAKLEGVGELESFASGEALLREYAAKLSFTPRFLVRHFDLVRSVLLGVPLSLALLSLGFLVAAWILGWGWIEKAVAGASTGAFAALANYGFSRGLKLGYAMMDQARPGDLLFLLLGKARHLTSTRQVSGTVFVGTRKTEIDLHDLRSLIVTKVLWNRATPRAAQEEHVLRVACAYFAAEKNFADVSKDVALDRLAQSLAFLELGGATSFTSYFRFVLAVESDDLDDALVRLDQLAGFGDFLQVPLYQAAIRFLKEYPLVRAAD